jgi:hypothetical protein
LNYRINAAASALNDPHHSKTTQNNTFQAEVVGHNGRIGSFLLNAGNGLFVPTSNRLNIQVAQIASCSNDDTPILVAVPSTEILNVFQSTPIERRKDLVIIANCLPSGLPADNMTYTVLHFGILQHGQLPVTNHLSPPTVVFGPHAKFLSNLLQKYGVKTKIASTFTELEKYALLKLLWVSFMWLLCHGVEDGNLSDCSRLSLTVTQVHETKQELLRALVVEAIPIIQILSRTHLKNESTGADGIGFDVNDIMEYLESYSRSMPNVTPSKDLAIAEFKGRNGVLLAYAGNQTLHSQLVHRVVGYIP